MISESDKKEAPYQLFGYCIRLVISKLYKNYCFPNGNGRHARIIADVVLSKLLKSEPIDWAGGFDLQVMNERREEYIQALREADKGEYAPMLEFVGVKEE